MVNRGIVPATVSPRVSIIIAGRNAAPWIGETIASALRQSEPCEVIYADDCSTDDTLAIARTYEAHGLRILPAARHGGVCATRNRGAKAARGEFLCFLDADDVMPPDFIAHHLGAMQLGCPFVYGAALAFGGGPFDGRLWEAMPFERWDRWSYNTVNTSALYARWAFNQAGGWIDAPTMWDHDLALRALRLGTVRPRVSPAVLRYRQHPQSFSASLNEKADELVPVRELIRRRNARLSLLSIYSGRLPEMFPDWIERAAQGIRFANLGHRPELIIAHDPRAAAVIPAAKAAATVWSDTFAKIQFLPLEPMPSFSDEKSRRDTVANWLARACQLLRETARGDVLWFVEDDMVLPRSACSELWNVTTSGLTPPEIVSAVYRSRHCPELLIAGNVEKKDGKRRYPEHTELPQGDKPVPVDFCGTGCVMIWKDRPNVPREWPSHLDNVPAHDWALSNRTRQLGGTVLWHPAVKVGHAQTRSDILWP